MTDSDRFLKRAPMIFYVLGGLFFIWSVLNGFWELRLNNLSLESTESFVALMKSKTLFQSAIDSVFLVANGVIVQALLKINEKVKSV